MSTMILGREIRAASTSPGIAQSPPAFNPRSSSAANRNLTAGACHRPLRGVILALLVAVSLASNAQAQVPPAKPDGIFRLLSFNIAHGRGAAVGMNGMPREPVEDRLGDIADLVRRVQPDVVAIQEVDGASSWTGSFDHLALLADRTAYPYRFHGIHHRATLGPFGIQYGTALLSLVPLENAWSLPLPSESWHTKGAAGADVVLQGQPAAVVSLHLDSEGRASRDSQVDRLVAELRKQEHPLILMGDFNSRWSDEGDAVRRLARELRLEAWQADSPGLETFSARHPRSRIDWALVDRRLEFVGYGVLSEALSDHLAVWADVRWRTPASKVETSGAEVEP